jgi:hypothetical protein
MQLRKVRCPHELYYANKGLYKQHSCYRSERRYVSFPLEIQVFIVPNYYITYFLQFANFLSKLMTKMPLEETVKDTSN